MTRRLRIVIADDEDDIRQGFCRVLQKLGCEVVGAAANGRELVALCIAEHPDLVITDIRMPHMTGIEAAKEIADTLTVPVIVVSSYECRVGEESGNIAEFLLKPVCMSELQAAIIKACPSV